jgi:uncharacterized membrane protein YoaK (UPF0700 family)
VLNPKAPLWLPYGSVRAILAILLVGVVCVMALQGQITGDAFLTIAAMAAAFYFGAKSATDPNKPAP